jgi:uncharacterized protein
MGSPVLHFTIRAKDAAALQRFYAELFGWIVHEGAVTDVRSSMMGSYTWLDTGPGPVIGGGIADERTSGGLALWVQVDDIAATLDRVRQLGGRVLGPPVELEFSGAPSLGGPFLYASFYDPEGNAMSVLQPREA